MTSRLTNLINVYTRNITTSSPGSNPSMHPNIHITKVYTRNMRAITEEEFEAIIQNPQVGTRFNISHYQRLDPGLNRVVTFEQLQAERAKPCAQWIQENASTLIMASLSFAFSLGVVAVYSIHKV